MKNKISILILIALASASCNQVVKEERNRMIDSLGIHIQSTAELVAKVDSQLIMNRLNEIDRTTTWLHDNVTDTLERDAGITIGDYIRMKKFYGQAASRYVEVDKEVKYSSDQLANLRNDIKNNFYSEEEFHGYFKTESESVKSLVEAGYDLQDKYASSNSQYEHLKPRVKAIVDSVKTIVYGSNPL